ncbi:MAG: SusD/RagB family nutrient-binding outer membrane lipoprotein [Bacteroidetes bacterium]|nr:SusD/RagB family nutrient-binding outer membrane lipoprotein [Bacteroidota bacterium]
MKNKIQQNILHWGILSLLLVGTLTSCSDFLNVNTNPAAQKNASVPLVLTSSEGQLAFYMGSDFYLYSSIFTQQSCGQGSATQTRFYDQYILTNADVNNSFTNYYAGVLADLDYIKKNTYQQGNPQYGGIAKLLQAYTYGILVDMWGAQPYTNAMKGVANPQPQYDSSKTIYDSLFVLIDKGIADLGKTNTRPVASEDQIYGGNISKWIKFGNTLKLRLALHYAKVDAGAKLQSVITANGPFMASNADNFQMTFDNVTNRQNPIHQFEIKRADYDFPGAFMVNMMNTKNDPRRPFYFTSYPAGPAPYTTGTGTYKGAVSTDGVSVQYSRIHTYLRGAVSADNGARSGGGLVNSALTYSGMAPQRMLTFAEYNFIMAEAVLAYSATAALTADQYYQAGVTASMQDAGVLAANITTYTAALAPVTLQTLIEEKYVALYGVPVEPWTDWRRTNFPSIAVSPSAALVGNNTIPRILVYPLSEQQTNANNVPSRASIFVKGVFWDN